VVQFFGSYDGVRLCPSGTATATGPTVHSPHDTHMNMQY